MNETVLPRSNAERLIIKELPNETLVYDVENNRAFCLNEMARSVFNKCDGKTTFEEVIMSLGNVSDESLLLAINELNKAGLLKTESELPVVDSVSRRKMIKAAMTIGIAIPVVTSLVVPTAVNAQSGCIAPGQPCTPGGTACCSGNVCEATCF